MIIAFIRLVQETVFGFLTIGIEFRLQAPWTWGLITESGIGELKKDINVWPEPA